MYCKDGKGSVLHRGIAAVLMLILITGSFALGSRTAIGAEYVFGTETTSAADNVEVNSEATQSDGVALTENGTGIEDSENVVEDIGIILFAPEEAVSEEENSELSTAVTSPKYVPQTQTVKFGYTKKMNYENYNTHNYYATCNGKTVKAYCIEPKAKIPSKKTYTAKPYNGKLMKKALYYSIGYPGYSLKTSDYLSGVSRKSCYKGDSGAYMLCHILLSYIYDNKSSTSDAFIGASNSTKTVIKKFSEAIESWPDPPESADIGLSASSVKAEWNENTRRQETPKITATGTPTNTIQVPVPTGAAIVKDDMVVNSGIIPVKVGESFMLTAPSTVQDKYSSPSLPGSIEIFQPYIIKPSGKQGQMFGISVTNSVAYNVEWEDFGSVEIKKTSSDEATTSGNLYYSLEGAEYGLYSKSTSTLYGKLITDDSGCAILEDIPYGDYYLKEHIASPGYKLDLFNHEITVSSPNQSETLIEVPNRPDIQTTAVEESTGDKSFYVRDNTTGEDTSIVDTVTYNNLVPEQEYRIEARLVDKASGINIPCRVEEVKFTPESSTGKINITYNIDSSMLGGKAAVAFEKLYYKDCIIAVHEDLNNKAQTVNILKPLERSPDTGNHMPFVLVFIVMGMSVLLAMAALRRKN